MAKKENKRKQVKSFGMMSFSLTHKSHVSGSKRRNNKRHADMQEQYDKLLISLNKRSDII